MSERFLEGYLIDKLPALGDAKLAAAAVRKKAKAAQVTDVEMTLGEGERKPGKALATKILDAMAADELDDLFDDDEGDEFVVDDYAVMRVAQMVLSAYGTSLGTIEMPFVEGDPNGFPTGVWKALKMPVLAKLYGKTSFAWPTKKPGDVDWPIAMQIAGKDLAAVKAELAKPRDVEALPLALFVSKEYGTEKDVVEMTREELGSAFDDLAKWVTTAVTKKKTLVIVLDGDQ
ncbi:MAG: hypothetical protein QM831_01925 [Kofleriaceae bacterium]